MWKNEYSLVKQYLNGERGSARTAKEAGISSTTLKRWCAIYENEGPAGLIATRKNKVIFKGI
ncbi:MAG: helix-turn-helix domain-containing protein [Enterococcus raffinosus]